MRRNNGTPEYACNMKLKLNRKHRIHPDLRPCHRGVAQYSAAACGDGCFERLHRVPPEDQPQHCRRLEHQPALRGEGRLRRLPRRRAPIHQRRRQGAVPDARHVRRVPRHAGQAIQRRQARTGLGGHEGHAHDPLAAHGDDRGHERLRRLPQDRAEDAPGNEGLETDQRRALAWPPATPATRGTPSPRKRPSNRRPAKPATWASTMPSGRCIPLPSTASGRCSSRPARCPT